MRSIPRIVAHLDLDGARVLGRRSLIDAPTVIICLATLCILTYVRRVPEPLVIVAGLLGLGLKSVVG
jgi:hypothetical protein